MATKKKPPPSVKKDLLKAAKAGERMDTLAGVVERFVRLNGGTDGLAKMLTLEYAEAKPGSLLRQRILDMILRCWKYLDEKTGHIEELGILSDEDLDREFEKRLKAAGITDDEAEEPEAADAASTADEHPEPDVPPGSG
jgi:hypothetical protein